MLGEIGAAVRRIEANAPELPDTVRRSFERAPYATHTGRPPISRARGGASPRGPRWATMRRVRNRPVLVFLAATFGFSWGLWALMILSQRGLLPFTVPTHWSGSFGPAVGAIVAIAWSEGRTGLRTLFGRLFRWRAGLGVWFVALAGIVVADAAALALYALRASRVPALAPFTHWATLAIYLPIILVIGGPLGEELGWRGFLQPHLQRRLAPIWASGLVGFVWTVWHAPLVWLEGAAQKGASMVAFALAVVPLAYVFAWTFNGSGGSLLLPLVLHTTINTVTAVVEPEVLGPLKDSSALGRCFIGVCWAAALLLVLSSRRSFLARPTPSAHAFPPVEASGEGGAR